MKSAKASAPTPPPKLLQLCNPEALQREMQQIQHAISSRAFELFESRNREHGHDWEDWFQAESELLRPVSIAISDTPDRFSIRANVLGLTEHELKVSVEAKRIAILGGKDLGKKETTAAAGAKETPPADVYPDRILRLIALSSEVDPAGAVVELQSGVLRFELPKVKKAEAKVAAVAGA